MPYREQLAESIERLTRETLENDCGETELYAMVDAAAEASERALTRVLAMAPPPMPIACKAGCPWCCTMKVAVTPPEALRIAQHLRDTLAEPDLSALRHRIAATTEITHGLAWQEHIALQILCPLNVDGSCSIHLVRPLVCRSHNSLDVERCKTYHDHFAESTIPLYTPQQDIGGGIADGLCAGCTAAGRHGDFVEFMEGLQIALETPDAADRWLAGDDLFGEVNQD